MKWAILFASLFKAATIYLELKNKSFYYDIVQKSKAKQDDYIKEIERLRARGRPADNDAADILRLQLLEEKQFIEHISTSYSSFASLSAN